MRAADARPDAEAVRPPQDEPLFRIIASQDRTEHSTPVSPDIATCDDCLREFFDPSDRRYHYPFINCTNCGPRFTIIRGLPLRPRANLHGRLPPCALHVQASTPTRSTAGFTRSPMPALPADRTSPGKNGAGAKRSWALHVKPATPSSPAAPSSSPATASWRSKGLGGFHLACRADSERAVRELRARKRRSNKPLAIMARDLDVTRAPCHDGTKRARSPVRECQAHRAAAKTRGHGRRQPAILVRTRPLGRVRPSRARHHAPLHTAPAPPHGRVPRARRRRPRHDERQPERGAY